MLITSEYGPITPTAYLWQFVRQIHWCQWCLSKQCIYKRDGHIQCFPSIDSVTGKQYWSLCFTNISPVYGRFTTSLLVCEVGWSLGTAENCEKMRNLLLWPSIRVRCEPWILIAFNPSFEKIKQKTFTILSSRTTKSHS